MSFVFGALAESVHFTGNCNVRQGPGLDYDVINSVAKGGVLEYRDITVTDERGVDWYYVLYDDLHAWVSSKYAVLEDGSGSAPTAIDDILPKTNGRTDLFYALSYATEDLGWLLDMQDYDICYANRYVFGQGSGSKILGFEIYDENQKYCIQGVTYGMSVEDAEKQLFSLGWKLSDVHDSDADEHSRYYANAEGNEIFFFTHILDDFRTIGHVAACIFAHDRVR